MTVVRGRKQPCRFCGGLTLGMCHDAKGVWGPGHFDQDECVEHLRLELAALRKLFGLPPNPPGPHVPLTWRDWARALLGWFRK